MKIVPAHNQTRVLREVQHFPDHEQRHDSEEFKQIRAEFHKEHAKCWVGNKHCKGPIQIHHSLIEWAESNEIEWDRVEKDYHFDHVDSKVQMMPLCERHHIEPYFGVHMISGPAFVAQRYMSEKGLDALMEAIEKDKAARKKSKEAE